MHSPMTRIRLAAPLALLCFCLLVGTAWAESAYVEENQREARGDLASDIAFAETLPDAAVGAIAGLRARSGEQGAKSELGATVFTFEHHLPIGGGRTLFVTESFTLDSLFRWPHRAVLFLSGSAFRGNHWNIPVAGYDGTDMLARRGFFTYTVDYLGVGESFRPADGSTVTLEANRQALEVLLRFIRGARLVPKVDLIGAGYGGSLATLLAQDGRRVRSVVMSAMLYDILVGGPLTDPAFVEMLENAPDGYAFFPGEASLIFMQEAPQEARDYVVATQGGLYPAENFLVAAGDLPFYDPSGARAPGLILFGEQDALVGPNGVDQLALDYGRDGALLVVNEQAGHAPRTGSPEDAAWFWRNIFAFIDASGFDAGLPAGIEFSIGGAPRGPFHSPLKLDDGQPLVEAEPPPP